MIGGARLVITREQLVAIVQEWWQNNIYHNAGNAADAKRSRVVGVDWVIDDAGEANGSIHIELEPVDAPSR